MRNVFLLILLVVLVVHALIVWWDMTTRMPAVAKAAATAPVSDAATRARVQAAYRACAWEYDARPDACAVFLRNPTPYTASAVVYVLD